jgi:outer membrane lipoprotein-sorting protein
MMGFIERQAVLRQVRHCVVAMAVVALTSFAAWAQASTEVSLELGPEQTEAVDTVNRYLNSFVHLEGDFRQVAPDGQVSEGRFFIRRPGRARFDYAEPNRLLVIADGFWIGIVDRKMRTTDRYPIGSTPYWALLKDEVDLSTDARILAVERDEDLILVSIDDPSGQAAGTLTLIFEETPSPTGHVGDSAMRLKHWLVTDAQGLTTSVEVSNLIEGRQARNNMFTLHQYDR